LICCCGVSKPTIATGFADPSHRLSQAPTASPRID
jgi:hypothetical protein